MITAMNKTVLGVMSTTLFLGLLVGCQTAQPFNGKTGYQRESSNQDQQGQVIISYTLDAKASEQSIHQKLRQACARELGIKDTTTLQVHILNQREFASLDQTADTDRQTIKLGNSERAAFGLSATPKLSNTSTGSGMNPADIKPRSLKQITAECRAS